MLTIYFLKKIFFFFLIWLTDRVYLSYKHNRSKVISSCQNILKKYRKVYIIHL